MERALLGKVDMGWGSAQNQCQYTGAVGKTNPALFCRLHHRPYGLASHT